jgi:trehalose 6-phosphate synthase
VNEKFARAFLEEHSGSNPIALIQDYHFALLPQMIRAQKPDAILSLFWHIPWPNPEAFGICPWKKDLLLGMLGADLIGFHTQYHCNNFLDTVDRFLEARVDREQFSVTIQGHVCYVKPFAISVEWPSRHDIQPAAFPREREDLLAELNLPAGTMLGIGVDRVDYTKGIIERFRSVERLLEKHPEHVGKFVFVQIGAPSRTHIKRYQDLNSAVQEEADRINWKFGHAEAPPILLKLSHHNGPEIHRYYRAAELCFVSSLHDGMNLVAKEYVSAHSDGRGALVLSNFAGAARDLGDALLVNPYDTDECAEALHHALTMPEEERRQRMQRMRAQVSEKNVYAWAGSFLAEINRIAQNKAMASQLSQVAP